MEQKPNLDETARAFIHTLQHRQCFEELLRFYHPDIEQIEFPNALIRQTAIRNLSDLKAASERGKQVMQQEIYDIQKLYTCGNTVIVELLWTGILAIPLGNLPTGGAVKAYITQINEFSEGKIIRQRNYDCFEPFT